MAYCVAPELWTPLEVCMSVLLLSETWTREGHGEMGEEEGSWYREGRNTRLESDPR